MGARCTRPAAEPTPSRGSSCAYDYPFGGACARARAGADTWAARRAECGLVLTATRCGDGAEDVTNAFITIRDDLEDIAKCPADEVRLRDAAAQRASQP